MFTARWMIPTCRNPAVISRHQSPLPVYQGTRVPWLNTQPSMSSADRDWTAVIKKTSALTPMSR